MVRVVSGREALNEKYAAKIARDWNIPRIGVGYVTRFWVLRLFLDHYQVLPRPAARTIHEYWIPAEDLPALNASIVAQSR
jgi:hypothetical protein